jgi:hypothetical protein
MPDHRAWLDDEPTRAKLASIAPDADDGAGIAATWRARLGELGVNTDASRR